MAMIDRVIYEGPPSEEALVWRWPSEDLTLGTQLIVNQSQEAILFKGGQALDVFGPGTHTLATDNIPLLRKLINLPFGGKTPFTAEVYYVNKHAKLDMTWGSSDPFRVTDPTYHLILPVRAFGQLGIRVTDSRAFVTQLVGIALNPTPQSKGDSRQQDGDRQKTWHTEKVKRYFEGLVVTKVKDCIAKYVVDRRVSIMDITGKLDEISQVAMAAVAAEYQRFGIEIVNFYVMSINVPDDDPSVQRIQEIMATRAEFEQLGDAYRVKRTFDTLQKAAENEGGPAGALLSGGLGLGMGLGAGPAVGASLGSALSPTPSAGQGGLPPVAVDPQQRLAKLKSLRDGGLISDADFDEKKKRILDEI